MGKIRATLGDNIRTLRTNKGWTQVYLADRLQITAPFLAQIESGKRGVSLDVIESVAELFDVPVASLFLESHSVSDKRKGGIRSVALRTVEKQLKESISESISKAFEILNT